MARLVRSAIRLVRPGGGSSVPGRVAARIQPKLVTNALAGLRLPAVLVSGSAGKSTTTKLLVDLLRSSGLRVFTNPSTSNIRQGFFSAVLTQSDWFGRIQADIAVIEADEGHAPALASDLRPGLAVITNVMSDQLDRFVDPEVVIEKLSRMAALSKRVLINADDSNLLQIAADLNQDVFSVRTGADVQSRSDYPKYAFNDRRYEDSTEAIARVLEVESGATSIQLEDQAPVHIKLVAPGAHMALNTALSLAAAKLILKDDLDPARAVETLNSGAGVFARWEEVELAGVVTRLMLVQNPGSFQINLNLIDDWPERVLVGIGRDVHDPSWLWTVNFSGLDRVDMVAGFNAAEAAARLLTANVQIDEIQEDIPLAIEKFLSLPVKEGGARAMVITADAMRRIRRHLRLAK